MDTMYPTFQNLYYSERDNTYTTPKAKRIAEEVDNQVVDLSQGLPDGVSPTPAETSSIFIGVAQHPVKNRVFGVGSLYSPPSICSRWEGGRDEAPSSMQFDSALRSELDVVRAKLEASEKAREDLERRQVEATGASSSEGDVSGPAAGAAGTEAHVCAATAFVGANPEGS